MLQAFVDRTPDHFVTFHENKQSVRRAPLSNYFARECIAGNTSTLLWIFNHRCAEAVGITTSYRPITNLDFTYTPPRAYAEGYRPSPSSLRGEIAPFTAAGLVVVDTLSRASRKFVFVK